MKTLQRCKPLLGTFVEVSVTAEASHQDLVEVSNLAFHEVERIHHLMSFHEPESELSRINQTALNQPCEIFEDTMMVLKTALEMSARTNGIFDISVANTLVNYGVLPRDGSYGTVKRIGSWRDIELDHDRNEIRFHAPLAIDLGGIAKGFAVDKAMAAISDTGLSQVSINAGGDMRFLHWERERVDVRIPDPKARNKFVEISMQAPALATSAPGFEGKQGLIIDAIKGKKITRRSSASVFAPTCMLADALTKVAFLDPNYKATLSAFGASVIFIDANGKTR